MKIGIVTILKVNNYGAELQAYATQAILKKLGYEAELIDYLFYKNRGHRPTRSSRPLFKLPFMEALKEWAFPKMTALQVIPYHKAQKSREKRFELFHKENTSLSRTYHSINELYSATLDYDVYMTGSDQVWNPGIYSSLNPYFLTFAPKGKRRVAYASSFGVQQIPDYAKDYYRERLQEYDVIGVREKNAVDIVEQLTGKQAEWVLDPTLLLSKEEWLKVTKPIPNPLLEKPYILLYELTPCPYIRSLAEHFKKEKGWQIVRVCKSACKEDKDNEILNITDAGPAEFLNLLANASLVITNSFHGTAFSINFNRDFYTVIPLRKQNNSRQRSLLDMVDLSDRLLIEGATLPDTSKLEIDYSGVNKRLGVEKKKSIEFLTTAVNGK